MSRGSKKHKWNGAAMKKRRLELGLTLQEVADYINTSKSYTWEIEQGSQPTIGYAYNISKILKKPLAFFIEEC